jgi:hypothetical protein
MQELGLSLEDTDHACVDHPREAGVRTELETISRSSITGLADRRLPESESEL